MEDVSSIDSLSEKDIDIFDEEDEDKNEMLSLLSEMVFIAPFEKYVINTIDNYKEIPPLFEEKEYSLDEIISEFKTFYPNILFKDKKKMNKSLDDIPKKEKKNLNLTNKSEKKRRK